MSHWTLNLWPTTRNASIVNDSQLDYQWTKDGNAISLLPPVIKVGSSLEIYFSYSEYDQNRTSIPEGTITGSIIARGDTPPLTLVPTQLQNSTGYSWQVDMPTPASDQIYRFRVLVEISGSSPKAYTVDPEMVILTDGGATEG